MSSSKSQNSGDVDPYTKERVAVYHPEHHFKIIGKQSPLRSQLHRFLRVWDEFKCCDERDEPSKDDDWTADPNKSKPDLEDTRKSTAPTPPEIVASVDDRGVPVEIVQYCDYGSFNYMAGPNDSEDEEEEEEEEDMDIDSESDDNGRAGRPKRKGRKKELPPDYIDPTLNQQQLLEQEQKRSKVPRKGMGKRCYYTLNDSDSHDLKNHPVPEAMYDTQEFVIYGENLQDYQEVYPEECERVGGGGNADGDGRRATRGISNIISKKFPLRDDKKYKPPCLYLRGMDRDAGQMETLFDNRGRPKKYFTAFEDVDTDEIYNPTDKPVLWDVKNRRVVLCQNRLRQDDFKDFFKDDYKVVQYGDASPDYKVPTRSISSNSVKLADAKMVMAIEGTTSLVITGEKYRKARNAAHRWMVNRRVHEQEWATENQAKARFLLNKEVSEAKKRIAIRKHNLYVDHMLRPGQKFKKLNDGSKRYMVYVDTTQEPEKYQKIAAEKKSNFKGSTPTDIYTKAELAVLKMYNPNKDVTKRVPMYHSITRESLIGMDAPLASDLAEFFVANKDYKILNNAYDRNAVSRHQKATHDAMTVRLKKQEAEKNGWLNGDFSEHLPVDKEEYEGIIRVLCGGSQKAKRGRPTNKDPSNSSSSSRSSSVTNKSSSEGNPNAVGKWGEHDIVFESDMKPKDQKSSFWECSNCKRKNPNNSISCPKCGQRRKRDAKPVFRLSPDQHGLKYMSYASVENRNADGSAGTTYVLSDESRGPGTSFGAGGPPDGIMEGSGNHGDGGEWTESLRGRFVVLDEYNGTLLLPCGRSIKQRQNITRHRHSCPECQKMSLEDVLESCLSHTMPLIIAQREANKRKADRKRKGDQKSSSSLEKDTSSSEEEDEDPANKRNTRTRRGKGDIDKDEFGIRYAARSGSSSRDGKRYQADVPEMRSNSTGGKGTGRGRGRPRTVNLHVKDEDIPRVLPRRVYERDAYKYLFGEIDRMVEMEEEDVQGSDQDSDTDEFYRTGIDTAMEQELRTEEEKEENIEAIEDRLQSTIQEMGVNSNRLMQLELRAKDGEAPVTTTKGKGSRSTRTAAQKKDAGLNMCGKNPTESATLLCDLFHASKCPFEEGHCPTCVNCGDSKAVWKHIVKCHDDCDMVLCRTAKFSLEHFRTCTNKEECEVCSEVRATLRRRKRRAMEAGKIMRKFLVSIAY